MYISDSAHAAAFIAAHPFQLCHVPRGSSAGWYHLDGGWRRTSDEHMLRAVVRHVQTWALATWNEALATNRPDAGALREQVERRGDFDSIRGMLSIAAALTERSQSDIDGAEDSARAALRAGTLTDWDHAYAYAIGLVARPA